VKFFLSIFFLFPFLISAPLETENLKGTKSEWSSGVCCKTGFNYEINFSLKAKKAKRLKLDSICFDGYVFNTLRIEEDEQDKVINYTVKISYRQDNKDEQDQNYQKNNGLAPSPSYGSCESQILHYTYRGKSFHVELPELTQKQNLPVP